MTRTPSSCLTGPTPTRPRIQQSSGPSSARTSGAPGWSACAPAPTPSPRPACSTGARQRLHWQLADDFRRRHPKVDLHPDVLFVDDGDILTSAGSAAAPDLSLHIVRLDHGAQIANFVSRRLVFSAFRDGGQQQFIEQPVTPPGQPVLSQTLDWAQARLGITLSVRTSRVTLTSVPQRCTAIPR